MFQLIVAVISIAMVVVLAVAMLWYGGASFFQGADKARYAQYMNSGAQIEGAMRMYQSQRGVNIEGAASQVVPLLVTGDETYTYLNSPPQGTWYVDQGTIYRSLEGENECKRINIVAKGQAAVDAIAGDGCPACTDTQYSDWPGCRREAMPTVTP